MKFTESAGGVVVNKDSLVLVVNQNNNSWSLPKGHIDEGEEKIEAAVREIYEESGIEKLQFIRDLGSYQRHKIGLNCDEDKSELKTIHMFLFSTSENNLKPLDKTNPEARWIEKENVAGLLTHKKDKEFFLSIKDQI